MITVHNLNNSRSHRIVWCLEELKTPYEIKHYERHPKTYLAPKELYDVHPLAMSPMVTDDNLTIAESGAIIEYVLYKYGNDRLKPTLGSPEWVQYLFWLHFTEGSFMPLTLLKSIFELLVQKSPFFIRPIAKTMKSMVAKSYYDKKLKERLDFTEDTLTKSKWLAGEEFTAADIQMSVSLMISKHHGIAVGRPHISDYLKRIEQRPAFIRTLELCGPLESPLNND